MEIKLKEKYRLPSAHRGRSYRSSSMRSGDGKPKIDGAALRLLAEERKAQRARNEHIKVTLVLVGGRHRVFRKEYV